MDPYGSTHNFGLPAICLLTFSCVRREEILSIIQEGDDGMSVWLGMEMSLGQMGSAGHIVSVRRQKVSSPKRSQMPGRGLVCLCLLTRRQTAPQRKKSVCIACRRHPCVHLIMIITNCTNRADHRRPCSSAATLYCDRCAFPYALIDHPLILRFPMQLSNTCALHTSCSYQVSSCLDTPSVVVDRFRALQFLM